MAKKQRQRRTRHVENASSRSGLDEIGFKPLARRIVSAQRPDWKPLRPSHRKKLPADRWPSLEQP